MDILLHHGDHERNAQGFLQRAGGARESIQQAMIRLSVPQGSFALDKNLGSRLHTLPNAPKERQEELALEYADRVIGIRAGRIVYDGPSKQVDQTVLDAIYGEDAVSEAAV